MPFIYALWMTAFWPTKAELSSWRSLEGHTAKDIYDLSLHRKKKKMSFLLVLAWCSVSDKNVRVLPFKSRFSTQLRLPAGAVRTHSPPEEGRILPVRLSSPATPSGEQNPIIWWAGIPLLVHLLTLVKEFYHFLDRLFFLRITGMFPLEISLWNSHCSSRSHHPVKPCPSPEVPLLPFYLLNVPAWKWWFPTPTPTFQGFLQHGFQTLLFTFSHKSVTS